MSRPVCPLLPGEARRWAIDPPVAIFHTDMVHVALPGVDRA